MTGIRRDRRAPSNVCDLWPDGRRFVFLRRVDGDGRVEKLKALGDAHAP